MKKEANSKKLNIILGVSGGIAAYKCCELVRMFIKEGHSIKVVMTNNAKKFITPLTMETLSGNKVYTSLFKKESFSTEHITLSKWGDVLIVAPATANVIGKFAYGIADDILSTLFLSFPKPVIIAPAMHKEMYSHKIVVENILKLKNIGINFIDAEKGELASGDIGEGRLADPQAIKNFTISLMNKKKELSGKRVLITAGPTHEKIDPVRFISSPSSGKMGIALAREAERRGADVTFIHGHLKSSPDFLGKKISVTTAKEMNKEVIANKRCDIFISTAAVSDFAPKTFSPSKIKKDAAKLSLELVKNPDILENFSKNYGKHKIIVGFAAETENLDENAREKLRKKKLDMIVANDVSRKDSGFGTDTNLVTIFYKNGRKEKLPILEKSKVAEIIFDRIFSIKKDEGLL